MYNTDLPRRADLPTSTQLLRSTIIAVVAAMAILVTVVLPAEYAIDPTGAGRLIGLTQMGEIKTQLAAEAEADAATQEPTSVAVAEPAVSPPAPPQSGDEMARRIDEIEALIGATQPLPTARFERSGDEDSGAAAAPAAESPAPVAAVDPSPVAAEPGLSHEVSFTLAPGEGAEIKLVMSEGARANYAWTANGAVVNFDAHGDGGGRSVTYEKGRGVPSDEGFLEAAFDGNHGWFWRNRTEAEVTVTLRTSGDYQELKRLL